ncbi:MAG: VCBS repeat-containing protein [Phycisphaerae bacterium]|nr:VCBS repeat-containing protein [Phycisphaerae bacterium]
MMQACLRVVVFLAIVIGLSAVALADSPIFTPVHLAGQPDAIVRLKLSPATQPGHLQAEVVEMLKRGKITSRADLNIERGLDAFKAGKSTTRPQLDIDLTAAPHKAKQAAVAKLCKDSETGLAILFLGEFHEDGAEEGGGRQVPDGYMHHEGRWISLYRTKSGGLEMENIEDYMEGVWAGDTDQLLRMVKYVLTDRNPVIPRTPDVGWDRTAEVAKGKGLTKAELLMPVDLDGAMAATLFVGLPDGDRLYRYDAKAEKMGDVTARYKLASMSKLAAWADIDGDRRLDLISWDGRKLTVFAQQADATFRAQPVKLADADTWRVLGLATLGVAGQAGAGILVSTAKGPILLTGGEGDKWTATPLARGTGILPVSEGGTNPDMGRMPIPRSRPDDELKEPAACVVADLDGDGLPDVLEPFANGSLLHRGRPPSLPAGGREQGRGDMFAPPVRCVVAAGPERGTVFPGQVGAYDASRGKMLVGDFDSDGLLDIFAMGADRNRLWQNLGDGKFAEKIGRSGAIAYLSKPGGMHGTVCDVNNDNRADLLIVYPNSSPQVFFNIGFRSLDHAHHMDLHAMGLLPEAEEGCRAGCIGDFDGDGAEDMAVIAAKGSLHVFYRKVYQDENALCLRVALSPKLAGPVNVTVANPFDTFPATAWQVTAGQPISAGRRSIGHLTAKWRLPGGPAREKTVKLTNDAVRLTIEPEAKE